MRLRARLKKLEAGLAPDSQACCEYAEALALLDDEPWSEEEVKSFACKLERAGGPVPFEENLRELEV